MHVARRGHVLSGNFRKAIILEANTYFFFGLFLLSEISFSTPGVDCHNPDVRVRLTDQCKPLAEAGDREFYFEVGPQKAYLNYRNVGLFAINNGCQITVSPFTSSDPDLVINTVLGTPMGILLLQRGFLVLHASAVEINGRIVCFLGASGSGKSTTVCSLLQSGHKLVTDDVVAINTASDHLSGVLPGYPWMKVGRELISHLNIENKFIERLGRSEEKLRYNLPAESFVKYPTGRLACVYFLQWADDISIKNMKTTDAIINLVKHEYGFVPKVLYPAEEKSRFLRSAEFVKKIPCYSLQRPYALNKLDHLAGMIEKHVELL